MVSQILFLEILLVVLINQTCNLLAVSNLSLCPSPVRNQNCILQCSESNVSLPVTFEHPSGKIQGSCPVPGINILCDSANYTTYQSLPITYLNISSLDKNRDNGEWRCLHGPSSSETIMLYVSSPLRTQEKPQVTITETEIKITCAMLCQYPTTTIDVELLYAEEGTSNYTPFPSTPTLTIDSADSSGCENYESNYKAKFTFTKSDDLSTVLDKKITCKCNFTQSIIQTSEDTGTVSASFVFKFKYEKTTTTSITTEGSTTATTTTNKIPNVNKSTQHHSSSSSSATTSASTNSISVTIKMQIPNKNGSSKKSFTTYIIIGSVGGSALLVLICVVAVVLRRKFASKSDY